MQSCSLKVKRSEGLGVLGSCSLAVLGSCSLGVVQSCSLGVLGSCSRAVVQSWGRAVVQSCSRAVVQSCSLAVVQSCSLAVLGSCSLAVLQSCSLRAGAADWLLRCRPCRLAPRAKHPPGVSCSALPDIFLTLGPGLTGKTILQIFQNGIIFAPCLTGPIAQTVSST